MILFDVVRLTAVNRMGVGGTSVKIEDQQGAEVGSR
jgi:hypothetical protein